MDLIVIIPYFKRRFLKQSLESLAAQTDQDFRVWIGDDASPEDPKDVVREFESRLNLTYHRFEQNVGGRSIAAHWNRCVRTTASEWVWLFSDDDLASPDCVAGFREALTATARPADVYRMQSSVIDECGVVVRSSPDNPPSESAAELALCRMLHYREFYVQNHIFSRSSFEREGGMVDLPCGLFSEDASFVAMSRRTGIVTLPKGRLFWRHGTVNLNAPRPETVDKKLSAFVGYLKWVRLTFPNEGEAFERFLRIGASMWIRGAIYHLGGNPTLGAQLRFYGFFLRFAPRKFPGVFRKTATFWHRRNGAKQLAGAGT